jgi:hypothetical protein
MDWREKLRNDELELRAIVSRLGDDSGSALRTPGERTGAVRSLADKLSETRDFVDDILSGRNADEKAVLEYRLRVEYPLFFHLSSLAAMPREYVDWAFALV